VAPYGSVQWDGEYVAVTGIEQRRNPIWRLKIANFKAEIVGTVQLEGTTDQMSFWTNGSTIVATQRDKKRVGIWSYPTGGRHAKLLNGFRDAVGVAVSE
jgi:hypothetical protein